MTEHTITLYKRIEQLCEVHGGLNATARALGLSNGYLSRLASGQKTDPSNATLEKLGLRRAYTLKK